MPTDRACPAVTPLMNAKQCVSGMVNRETHTSDKSAPVRVGFACPDVGNMLRLPISRQSHKVLYFLVSIIAAFFLALMRLLQELMGKALEGGG